MINAPALRQIFDKQGQEAGLAGYKYKYKYKYNRQTYDQGQEARLAGQRRAKPLSSFFFVCKAEKC